MGGCYCGKMSGELTSLLSMIISFLLYLSISRSSGNSNSNLASVTSNFGLGLRQFDGTAAQSLRLLQNMILRVIFV